MSLRRITVMNQMAKGLSSKDSERRSGALKELERIKWFLWHDNVFKALQTIENLDLDLDDGSLNEKLTKLLKALQEFQTYIENNASFIPNYGERWRYSETISTAFVESTVNQVISAPHGQETADAVESPRCPSAAPGSYQGS